MVANLDLALIARYPHLASPMNLAIADGELMKRPYLESPHLWAISDRLVSASVRPDARIGINVPFRHGKTVQCSNYFPALLLLHNPHLKIMALCFSDGFAEKKIGQPTKDILERWGPALGIRVRRDSKAKGDWMIQGHDGGLLCRGRGGSATGRDADVLLLDDLIQNPKEATSPTIMENMWDWYVTVAQARLGPGAPIISVGTRWGRNDWFARVKEQARVSGEEWEFVRYPALAEEGDPLGRQVGEPLFPARVSRKRLEQLQKSEGRWFNICWQQKDQENEDGEWLQPGSWPRYTDMGHAWVVQRKDGSARRVVPKSECIILLAGDWAYSIKKKRDSSSLIVGALTPPYKRDGEWDRDILILEPLKCKVKPEQLAPECNILCKKWHPRGAGIEEGHPTLKDDVRRFPDIPPVTWFAPGPVHKLARAFDAIIMGQRGHIVLPEPDRASGLLPPGFEEYIRQLVQFSGVDEGPDTDDHVDATAWLAKLASRYRPAPVNRLMDTSWMDAPLTPGHNTGWR